MPRACSICTHHKRDAIDQALLNREPYRRISARFSLSEASVRRHRAGHLPPTLTQAREAQEVARADSLLDQVKAVMERVQKLFTACDTWLTDPSDPARYEIGPRAEDIQVIYSEEDADGKRVKRKSRLSDLLRQVSRGRELTIIEVRQADPRELVLKTANTLRAALEMMLKVTEVKDLEDRLEGLEKAIEEREERWTSASGSGRPRSALTGRR